MVDVVKKKFKDYNIVKKVNGEFYINPDIARK
jgi:hypothetical protein